MAHPPKGYRDDLILFAGLFSLYLLFLPAHPLTSPDEEVLLRTTISLSRGERGAMPPLPLGFATKTGRDGREYSQYGLGLPLASVPFLAVARSIHELIWGPTPGYSIVASPPFRYCAVVFNLLVTVLCVVVLRRLLIYLDLSTHSSSLAAFFFGIATIAWPHGRTFFSEPLASLCLLSSVAVLQADNRSTVPETKHLLLAGVCFGWGILTRLDTLVAAPAIAWETARRADGVWKALKRGCLVAFPVVFTLILIAAYNHYRFGSIIRTGYGDQAEGVHFATPFLVGLHGFLLTPGRSIFVYSPILFLAIPGTGALWRRDRRFAVTVALLVVGYLGVMSKWQNWAGGSDWGPRHIFQITPWLAVAAAVWWFERPKRSRWILLLLALSVGVQILGLLTDAVLVVRNANLDFDIIGKQMSVYDPARSTPVLHAQWLFKHPSNLLIADLVKQGSIRALLFLIPLCALALSIGFLLPWFQENQSAE